MSGGSWDDAYQFDRTPWDIGRPQPAIVRVADAGELIEPVLDSGCGSGEHALFAATLGLAVTGVDISRLAIERARAKARQRGLSAEFIVGDVLDLPNIERLDPPFRTVIDAGCFHTFTDAERLQYAASLAAVLEPGGALHLLCFSELTPGNGGPRRVTEAEIREVFSGDWRIHRIRPEVFTVSGPSADNPPSAWLARIVRL